MLATTIQITNNPPHTTHTNNNNCWPAAQAPTTHQQAVDAHTVLNVNPTVCSSITTFMPNPKRTHTHHPTLRAVNTCEHKKTSHHNHNSHAACSPQNWAP